MGRSHCDGSAKGEIHLLSKPGGLISILLGLLLQIVGSHLHCRFGALARSRCAASTSTICRHTSALMPSRTTSLPTAS